jgi:hypothetical protein
MERLTLKTVRETEKVKRHVNVYFNDLYLGYITKNESKFAAVGENWNFSSSHQSLKSFYGLTQQKVVNEIGNMLKLVMNNLDWGKTTEERNNNIGVYNAIKTEEEKQVFLTNLKYGTDKISSI